jgi:hypothetical protein
VTDFRLRHELEQLAGEMVRGAVAGRRVVHLVRVGLGLRDQFPERLCRDLAGMHDNDVRRPRDHGDRDEVLLQIIGKVGVDRRRDGVMRRANKERVTVRRRLRRRGSAGRPARSSLVLDQYAGAEQSVELGGKRPCESIGSAARSERHDPYDRLLRPLLGLGRIRNGDKTHQNGGRQGRSDFHGFPPDILASGPVGTRERKFARHSKLRLIGQYEQIRALKPHAFTWF